MPSPVATSIQPYRPLARFENDATSDIEMADQSALPRLQTPPQSTTQRFAGVPPRPSTCQRITKCSKAVAQVSFAVTVSAGTEILLETLLTKEDSEFSVLAKVLAPITIPAISVYMISDFVYMVAELRRRQLEGIALTAPQLTP